MKSVEKATFANGCFWCSEAVFQNIKGVHNLRSGFTGGAIKNPAYREVVQGNTGHAEAVQFEYDPAEIGYSELLLLFFTTHDPTTLNRQGNDVGTQYRSEIFYHSDEQRQMALDMIAKLNQELFDGKIVTKVTEAGAFYEAAGEHQNFYRNHREFPYCQVIIDPKIQKLKEQFSHMLKS